MEDWVQKFEKNWPSQEGEMGGQRNEGDQQLFQHFK